MGVCGGGINGGGAGFGVCEAGEMAIVEGGTHPTGMHSCLVQFLLPTNEVFGPGNIFPSICMSRRGVVLRSEGCCSWGGAVLRVLQGGVVLSGCSEYVRMLTCGHRNSEIHLWCDTC